MMQALFDRVKLESHLFLNHHSKFINQYFYSIIFNFIIFNSYKTISNEA